MSKGFKRSGKCSTNSPTHLPLQLIHYIQVKNDSICLNKTTVFHARQYGRFIEILEFLREKNIGANQGCNVLGGSFNNRENVSAQIQFRRERQYQHLKKIIFPLEQTNPFLHQQHQSYQVNQMKQLEITSCSSPQYLVGQNQVQMPTPAVTTNQLLLLLTSCISEEFKEIYFEKSY